MPSHDMESLHITSHDMSYHIRLWHVMACHIRLWHVIACHNTTSHDMTCHVMAWHVFDIQAIRAIYKLKTRESLREKFKEIKPLTVASHYIYNNVIFVHQHINNYKRRIDVNHRPIRHGGISSLNRLTACAEFRNPLWNWVYAFIIWSRRLLWTYLYIGSSNLSKPIFYYTISEFLNDKDSW